MKRRYRVGPVRDPLRLWFVEWSTRRGTWRRYFESRAAARDFVRDQKKGAK